MGEIRPKRCEGRELTKDQLAGALETQWSLLWSRLDPWVNASGIAHPILVLDNVPWAFCDPSKCTSAGSNTPAK